MGPSTTAAAEIALWCTANPTTKGDKLEACYNRFIVAPDSYLEVSRQRGTGYSEIVSINSFYIQKGLEKRTRQIPINLPQKAFHANMVFFACKGYKFRIERRWKEGHKMKGVKLEEMKVSGDRAEGGGIK